MKRFLPKTLTAQTILVLLLGLSISHFLSMVIYSGDRIETLSMLGGRNMAQRVASISHLIIDTPPEWRDRIVASLNEPGFRLAIEKESIQVAEGPANDRLEALKGFLRSQINLADEYGLHVQLFERPHEGGIFAWLGPNQRMHMQMMTQMHGITVHQSLRVGVELPDGQWLNFATDIPESNPFWSLSSLLSLALMAVAVVLLSVWVVRRITVPLRSFAMAAKTLGRDVKALPMDEHGPLEVQEAAKAFNEMQRRLQRLIENRTQMLAAISHDLRTPITLLRLRTELVADDDERDKMLATLEDMEHMISLTMQFAKQDAENEERRNVDLVSLLESVCNDFQDTGRDVAFEPVGQLQYFCAPISLKRAIQNLIENALKFAGRADVSINVEQQQVALVVEDDGPGIPDDQIHKVLQPFYRCENSRNRSTGGVGLGLSVTQSVVQAHGGDIAIENKPEGGLRITVMLPR